MSRIVGGSRHHRVASPPNNSEFELISKDLEKQLAENWDPVATSRPSLLSGAHLSNCKIEVNITYNNNPASPAKKRRRVFIEDSEE